MDKLNGKQKVAVWLMLALAVAMLVYPPRHRFEGKFRGYELIQLESETDPIAWGHLLFQYAVLGGIGWALVTSLKAKV